MYNLEKIFYCSNCLNVLLFGLLTGTEVRGVVVESDRLERLFFAFRSEVSDTILGLATSTNGQNKPEPDCFF